MAGMIAQLVSWIAAVPVSLADGYLLSLTLLSGELRAPSYGPPSLRFAIVVPAHDEQEGIASTVHNLLAIEYPKDLFSVVVVADNCSDETAARAERAGARVLVRQDDKLRGKGLGYRDLGLPAARACAQKGDADAAIGWLNSIPARFLPASVAQEPVFASLQNRPDFQAIFRRQ